ncbi:anthranilate phosphoribosyltransferase [Hyphobacterium sp. HN65]|uniref:Anthranilate phosphoribosyltransferase n=2 Tax=Hyphobacterium lacteum TaxID=3116575 RepID=A0ABU7LTZ5_9PROT|nr:anthranilate phosphoribosyltransferase [Hyphobacterium sp. HN65]MEE2526814.1 anthranilate phosphoribosyltransferase [Hyphobacterium sp. HN65]
MLLGGNSLTEHEAHETLLAMAEEQTPAALGGAVLSALRLKGETAEEIRGFANAMRALAISPDIPGHEIAVDIVGTGGDGSGSLNLSTGAALLTAACGVPVIKHGNRSISSRSGSADVLETLGLPMPLSPDRARDCLAETGFTFLFAPGYHPAMKAIGPVRKTLGTATVFNVLGPLTNPARPPYMVVGAFSKQMAELMAGALSGMDIKRAFVIHGHPGWDEATPAGPYDLFDVTPGSVVYERRDSLDLGLPRCAPEDLAGGDCVHNALALRRALTGQEAGPHADALVLGAALALEVTGIAGDCAEGMAIARAAIADGRAGKLLERLEQVGAPA